MEKHIQPLAEVLGYRKEIFQQSDASICARQIPINVASVPQRSPFRYPGGKTWFVPAFRRWLSCQQQRPGLLVEPFAGGATIGLTAICENLVDHALLVELDPDVAAVWHVLANGDALQLADRILTFDLTLDNVKIELSKVAGSTLDTAFKTIIKNRTYHGGILAAGSGLIQSGEAGKGITSRWYPMTLSKRLHALHLMRHRLTVLCEDALGVLAAHAEDSQAIFFVDPPYTAGGKKAGKRLYNYSELNHALLFDVCHSLSGDFVMTYDDAAEAHDMASSHGFDTRMIAMKNTHHAQMTELVIGRNLAWLD